MRASDADRDEAVSQLQEQFVAGRLSHDTFLVRVHSALSARRSHELRPLLADLPEPLPRRSLLDRARAMTAPVTDAVRRGVSTARYRYLDFPPGGTRTVFTIGREAVSDLVLADMTVSRVHARLALVGEDWMLADLGSTNGTRVNGWRVRDPVVVRAGDRVRFGGAVFVMRDVP
jgi:hypothetical protein